VRWRAGLALILGTAILSLRIADAGDATLSRLKPQISGSEVITLSGRTSNPAPEDIEERAAAVRWVGDPIPRASERWIRNVAQATLTPFKPTSKVSSDAAVIIAPGGAFMELAIEREGDRIAAWLAAQGIHAFVLKYRLMPMPVDRVESQALFTKRIERLGAAFKDWSSASDHWPLPEQQEAIEAATLDALEAVRTVRGQALRFRISPHKIALLGFSAGAITAVNATLKADAASRPDLLAAIYGGLLKPAPLPTGLPPLFSAAASDDIFGALSCRRLYEAWIQAGMPAELHLFENGGHGFGFLREGKASDAWPELFERWLRMHEFLR
jgi:acetyl esterase/lipase